MKVEMPTKFRLSIFQFTFLWYSHKQVMHSKTSRNLSPSQKVIHQTLKCNIFSLKHCEKIRKKTHVMCGKDI